MVSEHAASDAIEANVHGRRSTLSRGRAAGQSHSRRATASSSRAASCGESGLSGRAPPNPGRGARALRARHGRRLSPGDPARRGGARQEDPPLRYSEARAPGVSVTLRYTRSTSSAPPSASSATDSPSAPSRSTHSPLRRRASTPRCSARAATPARSARATRACDRDETCPRDATTRCHRARPRARVRREHAARPVADEPRQFNDPLRAELVVRERAPRHRVHDAVDPLVLRLRALLPREVLGVADLARLARLLCRRRRACHRGRAISSGSADVANAHGARAHRKPSVRAFSTYSDDARRERSVLALTAHSGLAREAGSTLGSRIDWATLMHRDTQRPDGAPPPTCASVARAVRTGTGRWTTYPRPHGARLLRPRGSASTSFASTAGASSSTGRRDLHRARGQQSIAVHHLRGRPQPAHGCAARGARSKPSCSSTSPSGLRRSRTCAPRRSRSPATCTATGARAFICAPGRAVELHRGGAPRSERDQGAALVDGPREAARGSARVARRREDVVSASWRDVKNVLAVDPAVVTRRPLRAR